MISFLICKRTVKLIQFQKVKYLCYQQIFVDHVPWQISSKVIHIVLNISFAYILRTFCLTELLSHDFFFRFFTFIAKFRLAKKPALENRQISQLYCLTVVNIVKLDWFVWFIRPFLISPPHFLLFYFHSKFLSTHHMKCN